MRAYVLVLVLTIPLAGCFDQGTRERAAALNFSDPQRLPGDQVGAEPNLITGPEGHVWVISPGSVVDAPNLHRGEVSLWHSADAGETWEAQRTPSPRDPDGPFCSCDTDVDLAPDGTLYITDFWVWNAGLPIPPPAPLPGGVGVNGFNVEASSDLGATWGPGNFVTQTNIVGNDRQYITSGMDAGEVYLSYARGTLVDGPIVGSGLWVLRSTDGGQTFDEITQAYAPPPAGGFAFIAKPRIAADSTMYFPWVEIGAEGDGWSTPGTVVVAKSTDHGASFERIEVAAIPNGVGGLWPLAADVGPDGLLHLVWMERVPDGGSVLWYSSSSDGAATFTPPRIVGWPDGTALLPWISHAGEGRAAIAFYGARNAVVPLDATEDQRWDAWAMVIGEREGEREAEPVRVSPWPVKVGAFCPQGASCPEDRELLDYASVGWRDGWVHVAFAASILDEGAGPPQEPAAREARSDPPRGGHATAAHVFHARARLE